MSEEIVIHTNGWCLAFVAVLLISMAAIIYWWGRTEGDAAAWKKVASTVKNTVKKHVADPEPSKDLCLGHDCRCPHCRWQRRQHEPPT